MSTIQMLFAFVLVVLAVSIAASVSAPVEKGYVMPWMCLEICDSHVSIQKQLQTIREHTDSLSGVSFELYTLSDDCALRKYDASDVPPNGVTAVNSDILAAGLESWPMISSWPHPDNFITFIRKVVNDEACSDSFIEQALREAKKGKYTGYNLDWEPTYSNSTAPVTQQDAQAYAVFVNKFAHALHGAGFKLGVDMADWATIPGGPSFWDYSALAATAADKGISMGTYTSNDDSFMNQLSLISNAFGVRAGVGLENVNASNNSLLSDEEVAFRFAAIKAAGVREVDIWSMPIPDNFWPFIEAFAAGAV